MSRKTRRQFLGQSAALGLGLLSVACGSVNVRDKPQSGFTRATSFAIQSAEDATETGTRLTARLISRGYNVIVASARSQGPENETVPRYVLEVNYEWENNRRFGFGFRQFEYTRLNARMVDRLSGQVVLTVVTDGGKIDETLDEVVDALDERLSG